MQFSTGFHWDPFWISKAWTLPDQATCCINHSISILIHPLHVPVHTLDILHHSHLVSQLIHSVFRTWNRQRLHLFHQQFWFSSLSLTLLDSLCLPLSWDPILPLFHCPYSPLASFLLFFFSSSAFCSSFSIFSCFFIFSFFKNLVSVMHCALEVSPLDFFIFCVFSFFRTSTSLKWLVADTDVPVPCTYNNDSIHEVYYYYYYVWIIPTVNKWGVLFADMLTCTRNLLTIRLLSEDSPEAHSAFETEQCVSCLFQPKSQTRHFDVQRLWLPIQACGQLTLQFRQCWRFNCIGFARMLSCAWTAPNFLLTAPK